jgi:hypothetical protein
MYDTVSPHAHESNTSFVNIPLARGVHAIVDPEDADLAQLRWFLNRGRYASSSD